MTFKIKTSYPEFTHDRISILCPSRNRPEQLVEMMKSALEMSARPDSIEFCLYIDADDSSYDELKLPSNVTVVRGPRMWLSMMYNSLLTAAKGEYLFWSGDDVEFKTFGWDEEMRNALKLFSSQLGVVHVNDMATSYPQKYATIGMVHRNWVKAFGYVFTPHLRDNGIDFWISSVSNQVNRRLYLPNVKVEHKQYRQGKVSIDKTYIDRLEDHKTYSPIKIYRTLIDERRRDALVLQSCDSTIKINFDPRYFLANSYLKIIQNLLRNEVTQKRRIYVGSMSNQVFLNYVFSKVGLSTKINHWEK